MSWQTDPIIDEPAAQQTFGANDPVVEQPQAQPTQPEPSMGQVAMNAVPKGLANFLNTPITLANLIMMGISNLPMAGHLKGLQEAAAEPELKQNPAMDLATQAGIVDPAKNPQTGPQRIVDTAIQAAINAAAVPAAGVAGAMQGAVVGAASGAAAQTTKEVTGSELLGVIVGVATPFALRSLAGQANKVIVKGARKETLKEAQEAGYVVEPSAVRQPTSKLETIAGKASIAQEAAIRNQEVTNKLAAKAVGLPDDTPLSMGVLEDLRKEAGKVYKEVADVSPKAAKALNGLQQARYEASDYFRYYFKTGDPAAGKQARSWQAKADAYEKIIEAEAKNIVEVYGTKPATATAPIANPAPGLPAGSAPLQIETREVGFPLPSTGQQASAAGGGGATINLEKIGETTAGAPDLLQRLAAARQLIARTHDVERALNLGSGNVSAPILGRLYDQGRPLSGELGLVARFAQAFPRVAREVEMVPPSGVSGTDAASSALLGTVGFGAGGPAGVAAAGLPLLRGPARNTVLSQKYQQGLTSEALPKDVTLGRAGMVGKTVEEQP